MELALSPTMHTIDFGSNTRIRKLASHDITYLNAKEIRWHCKTEYKKQIIPPSRILFPFSKYFSYYSKFQSSHKYRAFLSSFPQLLVLLCAKME